MAFDPMGNPGSEEPVEYAYDPYVAPEEPKKQRQKNLDWDKAFGMQRNPYAHTFKGPESPGGFGSVSSGISRISKRRSMNIHHSGMNIAMTRLRRLISFNRRSRRLIFGSFKRPPLKRRLPIRGINSD